jgi:hypothetical protein
MWLVRPPEKNEQKPLVQTNFSVSTPGKWDAGRHRKAERSKSS